MEMIALPRSTAWQRGVLVGGLLTVLLGWVVDPIWVLVGAVAVLATLFILRYPVAGLILLSFSVPWLGGLSISAGTFSFTPTDVTVAVVGGVWAARVAHRHSWELKDACWLPWIVLFLLVIVVSGVMALDRASAIREIVKWMELGVVYVAAVDTIQSDRDLKLVLWGVIFAGVSQALFGFVQVGLQAGPAAFKTGAVGLRAFGSFDQPNPFAGYLNMTLPFAFALGMNLPKSEARFLARVATLAIFAGVVVSASRGAFLAGTFGLVVIAVVTRPRLRPYFWLGVLLALVAAWAATYGLMPSGPVDRVVNAAGLGNVSFTDVTNANFSAVERAAHWLTGVRLFAHYPLLGVGIGNYAQAYPAFHPRGWYAPLAHAHNYYINIAAEAGILGLVAYVLLAGSGLWYSYRAVRAGRNAVRCAAALGVLGVLIATDIHNLFDVLYVHGMVALLGLLVALLSLASRADSGGRETASEIGG